MRALELPPHVPRRPIVGVMGSHAEAHAERAAALGRWIAAQGCHLLTGAGGGAMASVMRAFAEFPGRGGLAIGVVPTVAEDAGRLPLPGYPNPWVELPIYTHLGVGTVSGVDPSSRNHVNILTSTVVVLLPGAEGTLSEARLAVRYAVPCVGFLESRDELPGLPAEVPFVSDLDGVAAFVSAHIDWTVPAER